MTETSSYAGQQKECEMSGNHGYADEDEGTDFQIGEFAIQNWRWLLGGALSGLIAAGMYLWTVPPKYQATALVEIAQYASYSTSAEQNLKFTLSPTEPAELVIQRLRQPSSYTSATLAACGMGASPQGAEALSALIQAVVPRQLSTVVEVSVILDKPETAQVCVEGLFQLMMEQQASAVQATEQRQRRELALLRQQVDDIQKFLDSMQGTETYQTSYLAQRDALLATTRSIQTSEYLLQQSKNTRLVTPPFASPTPVFPRLRVVLVMGLVAGTLVGATIAVIQMIARRRKPA